MNDWRADGDAANVYAQLEQLPPYSNKEMNMKLNEVLDSKFLKQEDIDGEVTVTVAAVKKQNVAKQDDPPEYKLTVKWQEFEKPMVCNATNTKRMFKALGADTDDWIGQTMRLFVDHDVEYGGKIVGGLRVRKVISGTLTKARTEAQMPHGNTAPRKSEAEVNRELDDDIPF